MFPAKKTIGLFLIFVTSFAMGSPSWAAPGDQHGSDQGGDTPNVIGYQPIPNSALPGASGNVVPADSDQPRRTQQLPETYDFTTWFVGKGPYTLGRDDVIRIQVRNQPDFSGDFVVGPTGAIQYNYLGDVSVLGLTKNEVQEVITKLLEPYVRVPEVLVTIVGYNSKVVYVLGEVARPGKYIMRGDTIKLREAIVAAGLPTFFAAQRRTHVVKPDIKKPKVRKVDLYKVLYQGKLEQDIDIYPGEIVVVPSTFLSGINRFLGQLLSPATSAQTARSLATGGF
ncbi:MAG: polysaccharide export protein [Candidatus Omnitrophica bacterium]|nr:polysaccharide export protein [Candidatus Omnitrophota bacterium]